MSVDTAKSTELAPKPEDVTLTIDGIEVSVPKGSLIIRAAEKLGIDIPRFCDHPLLDPMGACRQCLVEIPDMGNGRGAPGGKPQASCTTEVMAGMKVETQYTSPVARKAQEGVLELLLINHPLDCPICDKGGECPLQNQVLTHGPGETRFHTYAKRTYPKPIAISSQILLDRERCVLCARCTRFSEQISGDPFIALAERGALQQVGHYESNPYNSYFSGNVVQICPVGALTSADYRFQARPFDLKSIDSTCEHCAAGCALRIDQRHYQVKRRLAGFDMDVNEEWNCDKGRFGFHYGRGDDRLQTPLIRENGTLRPASWPEAIDVAVAALKGAGANVGVLTGGRLTMESAYAYSKFARTVLGTNNIDFRSRPHTMEESDFLAAHVAGKRLGEAATYADLQAANHVVLVGFEPEDESPIVFLRLRKAMRKNQTQVWALAPFLSEGTHKLNATLIEAVPGTEASVLETIQVPLDAGSVILVGERAALATGTLTAAAELAERTGAKLAWVPRRAGDRGAVEAGCLPHLLPGGRPVAEASARVDTAAAWGSADLPSQVGLDADAILDACRSGDIQALVTAGIEPRDFRDPAGVRAALEAADFVISLETRVSEVTERAHVVLPVALLEEQSGTFLNWEHRERHVACVIDQGRSPMTDIRTLAALADAMGADLGFRTPAAAKAELDTFGAWDGECPPTKQVETTAPLRSEGRTLLATWRQLIDDSRGLDNIESLQVTRREPVARTSQATAERLGLGELVTVSTDAGSITLPLVVTTPMVDDVVWIPTNAAGSCVNETLQVIAGQPVQLTSEGVAR